MNEVRFLTLNPGHFHAALVQKQMYPGIVSPQVHVYAPLGPDLLAHLQRIHGFNSRPHQPTTWELEVHTGGDPLARLLKERPGNVVILSGRNRTKIDLLHAAVAAGLHVLADKPWIIEPEQLPRLESALDLARAQRVIAYDIMTERYEITSILQRDLVGDRDIFGEPLKRGVDQPAVEMESVHYLLKEVAGVPNRRPPWFFDIRELGEGLTDVGTHLVDLVQWILFPGQVLNGAADLAIHQARRWPTVISKPDFQKVTGEADFPAFLRDQLDKDSLPYYCNNSISYSLRGIEVRLDIRWDYEAAPGAGDMHYAVFRGSNSSVEIRQGAEEKYRPELFVRYNPISRQVDTLAAVRHKSKKWQDRYPGVGVEDRGSEAWITIPDRYRVGHEAHFAEVTRQFLEYLLAPQSLPAWEWPNLLCKYGLTTKGVQRARTTA